MLNINSVTLIIIHSIHQPLLKEKYPFWKNSLCFTLISPRCKNLIINVTIWNYNNRTCEVVHKCGNVWLLAISHTCRNFISTHNLMMLQVSTTIIHVGLIPSYQCRGGNNPQGFTQGWPWARARWATVLCLTSKLSLIPKFF